MVLSVLQDSYRVLNSAAKIKTSFYQLCQLAVTWQTSSTSSKLQMVLSGVISAQEIASEAVLISDVNYERRHFEDLQDFNQTLQIVNAPPPLVYHLEPLWFQDDTLQRSRAWRGIGQVVKSYQHINARFEKLQWIGLVLHIFKSLQQGQIPKQAVAFLLLQEGHKVLKFHAKARCDSSLSVSWAAKCLLYPYEALQFALAVRSLYFFARKWFSPHSNVLVIGEWHLVPYEIPPRNDTSLQYERMDEKYHAMEPFRKHICHRSNKPVTQALFIYKEGQIYMFEKKELVAFIYRHDVLCIASITFVKKDIYIDSVFNANLEKKLKQQNEEG